jgi:hypothetical protein
MSSAKRGEVWLVDLNPTRGQEIRKTRPVLRKIRVSISASLGAISIAADNSCLMGDIFLITIDITILACHWCWNLVILIGFCKLV